jgi:hypothetical protein
MRILEQKQKFLNQTVKHMPAKLRLLYEFGIFALSCSRIMSIRGNARCHIGNHHTAKSKAFRLLNHDAFTSLIPELLQSLSLVHWNSIISLDFSDFHGWQVLTFALHTRKGRAIPVYFEIIRYPLTKDWQNVFIKEAVEHFVSLVGCTPMIVMDRGFACPSIAEYLADTCHPFIIRIKQCKQYETLSTHRKVKANNAPKGDLRVCIYNKKLRLVISDLKPGMDERWYLITNDTIHARSTIIKRYYYRFEIEEFFKDAKWIQGMEHTTFEKKESIAIVLWFVLIGWWIMYRARPLLSSYPEQKTRQKNRISFMRAWMEAEEREKNQLVRQYYAQQLTPVK